MPDVRPIPGWPEYGATADGRIWSFRSRKFIAQRKSPLGYLRVNLCVEGNHKTLTVHKLVAAAWIPNPKKLPWINHLDSNLNHNSVPNLERCTPLRNVLHCLHEGNGKIGERHPRAKLTRKILEKVRREYARGDLQRVIGKRYGVTQGTISAALTGKNWAHAR